MPLSGLQIRRRRNRKRERQGRLKIEDFFKDNDRLHVSQRWIEFAIHAATILTAGLYIYSSLHGSAPIPYMHALTTEQSQAYRDVLNFLATAAIAIWASLAVVFFLNKGNLLRIESVKSLAREDCLEFVFNTLRKYENKYVENKHVTIVLEKALESAHGLLIAQCTHSVTMQMKPNRPVLILEFDKLSRVGPEEHARSVSLLSDLSPDDLWSIDTTEIDANFPGHEDLFPGITEVIIDSVPQKLRPSRIGARSRWEFRIDEAFEQQKTIDVRYRYEYAQEIPGFSFVEVFEPTRGLTCTFDFRKVIDRINCYSYETIDATRYRHDAEKIADGFTTVSYGGWVMPRGAVTFCWYRKDARAGHAAAVAGVADTQQGTDQNGDTASLSADGNCLGLALRDSWGLAGVTAPPINLANLRTVKDAYLALNLVRPPVLVTRTDAGRIESVLQRLSARWMGLGTREGNAYSEGDVILCLRSMSQLYGIKRSEAHWVVVEVTGHGMVLHDRLWPMVHSLYPEATRASAHTLLDQTGPSMYV